jgi:hypothetical protein
MLSKRRGRSPIASSKVIEAVLRTYGTHAL